MNRILKWYKKIDVQLLLASQMLLMATPLLELLGVYNRQLYLITRFLMILSAFTVVSIHKRYAVLGRLLGLMALTAAGLGMFYSGSGPLDLLGRLAIVAFLVFVFGVLIRKILKATEVSGRVLVNVVSGYLLLGINVSILALGLSIMDPLAYNVDFEIASSGYDFLYYGFMTVNTVGYGDILPLSAPAKSLATIGSTCGLLYMAIVMAIIVSKYVSKK